MAQKFKKHKLAQFSLVLLGMMYFIIIFAEFFAVQGLTNYAAHYTNAPPSKIHWVDHTGKFHLRPFIYEIKKERDPETWRKIYKEDTGTIYPIYFFTRGEKYKMWGLIPGNIHLFTAKIKNGAEDGSDLLGPLFLIGTDMMGRDIYSRIIHGGRISLSIGFVGVLISLLLGIIIGGISGYFGGWIDNAIQRVIEILRSFPSIPLWLALSAAIPPNIPPLQVYFYISIILSFLGWTGLARKVRSKFIALREEDYVMAAKVAGCTNFRIIRTHLIPGFFSYLIVDISLSIPRMILSETSLSFLGLGIRSPITSWGVLLQEAQSVQNVALYPWLLTPVIAVIISVLAFNFLGDGLRDAADPYK
ncbi:MAG: ABC transporter permease [Spirochaetes bacterium]|nr:ABC transporter permease [Spirochaetota bacterium]